MFQCKTRKMSLYYDQVIDIYKQTGYSPYRIAQIIPLGKNTIKRWIANFVSENGGPNPATVMRSKKTQSNEELESLEARVADLEEQLRLEKMRTRLNEKIIEIAEKKYNIPIRKKAGAKQ